MKRVLPNGPRAAGPEPIAEGASLRARLRAETEEVHLALHGAPPFDRVAARTIAVPDYVRLLAALHRFHAALAPVCRRACAALGAPELIGPAAARRLALERDLAFFGVAPFAAPAAVPDGAAFAVGCLYTVQGSALGGRVVHRQLEGQVPDGARTFFAGTSRDGDLWRGFCLRLDRYGRGCDPAEAVAGARFAFRLFAARLEEAA